MTMHVYCVKNTIVVSGLVVSILSFDYLVIHTQFF